MAASYVSELTVNELRELIREVVRQTLVELLTDPDAGLELREDFVQRLQQSVDAVHAGQETKTAEDVAGRLGLDW